jgi:hypothetical protein
MAEDRPFKFKLSFEDAELKPTNIDVSIDGDIEFGLERLKMAVDRRLD